MLLVLTHEDVRITLKKNPTKLKYGNKKKIKMEESGQSWVDNGFEKGGIFIQFLIQLIVYRVILLLLSLSLSPHTRTIFKSA